MDTRQIIAELLSRRDALERAISALEQLAGEAPAGRSQRSGNGRRRKLSAAARAKISEGMRRRWAERKNKG